ncbi:hypothetical protein N9M41_00550 [Rhodopirellula sp.]|nr:hypothetical protein [Rhodopirellula sp.]
MISLIIKKRQPRPVGFLVVRVFLLFSLLAGYASGYTPTDPVVTKMVDRGLAYLETLTDNDLPGEPGSFSGSSGVPVLVAYAHHKCRHDPEHPIVKRGLSIAERIVGSLASRGASGAKRNYEAAVCVLLFAEVDPDRYRPQMETVQKFLFDYQGRNGSFGYPMFDEMSEGDISQTQYALLAIWTLDRNGLPLDYAKVASALQWLMRVQDVQGGWPYFARDSGPGRPLTSQTGARNHSHSGVSQSMAIAGGSSVLIAGDALRIWGDTNEDKDPGIAGLPEAIKLFKEDENKSRRSRVKIAPEPVLGSVSLLNRWRQANPASQADAYYFYRLYTLERLESFWEIAKGLPKDSSPAWYNQGVDELRKLQQGDGSFNGKETWESKPIATAFSLLFLIRSTQKTIFTMSQGSLAGGYGLPSDTTDIRVDGTQIKGRPVAAQVTDMLDVLEKDGPGDTEGKSLPDDLQLSKDPKSRAAQLDRLERLVRGSKSWQARRVAAQLLARSDDLRVVPSLIYALSDPDGPVKLYARDGLRFLSRKFDGFGMSDEPSRVEIEQAQQKWRDWYRTINPKYVFLDYDL